MEPKKDRNTECTLIEANRKPWFGDDGLQIVRPFFSNILASLFIQPIDDVGLQIALPSFVRFLLVVKFSAMDYSTTLYNRIKPKRFGGSASAEQE
ncbi:unnamed protein product, partial [Dovyalis caffra]